MAGENILLGRTLLQAHVTRDLMQYILHYGNIAFSLNMFWLYPGGEDGTN